MIHRFLCNHADDDTFFIFRKDSEEVIRQIQPQQHLPVQIQWSYQKNVRDLFKANFEQISHIVLVLSLVTLNK